MDLVGALLATGLAGAVYLLALSLDYLPSPGYGIILYAWTPACAAIAAAVLWTRSRAESDQAVRWVAAGVTGSLAAIVLQMISIPIVSPSGGPFATTGDGSTLLYLLFHWSLIGGALAGALDAPTRWRLPVLGLAVVLALTSAMDLIPTPSMMRPDQSFARITILLELATAVVAGAVTVVWVLRSGRSAPALRGWVAVALALNTYELLLNALAGRRYNSVWWASLSMRVATYGVLALAGVVTVLIQLYRQEHYTETELSRREGELETSLASRGQLLASAERLARAASETDVARVAVDAAIAATEGASAAVGILDSAHETVRLLAHVGLDVDASAPVPADAAVPMAEILRTGDARYTRDNAETRAAYPGWLTGVPVKTRGMSVAAVPLRLAGELLGALVVTDTRRRDWPTGEREVLGGLADQTAQALGRARLYEQQRSTAAALQRGMLPRSLRTVPGVQVVARYLPAAKGMTVGGDWYDCIPLPDGRVILVVGDVMGKGAQAAAIMGRARTALHALATVDPRPSFVLSGLDRLVMELTPDGFFTLLYVLVNPADGTAEVARAGHLPLMLAAPDGTVVSIAPGGSPAIGIAAPDRAGVTVPVPPGSTLALFTDGLVEDRTTGTGPGMDHVARGLRDHAASDLDSLADRLLTLNDTGGLDDTCLLIARVGVAVGSPDPETVAGSIVPARRSPAGREPGIRPVAVPDPHRGARPAPIPTSRPGTAIDRIGPDPRATGREAA